MHMCITLRQTPSRFSLRRVCMCACGVDYNTPLGSDSARFRIHPEYSPPCWVTSWGRFCGGFRMLKKVKAKTERLTCRMDPEVCTVWLAITVLAVLRAAVCKCAYCVVCSAWLTASTCTRQTWVGWPKFNTCADIHSMYSTLVRAREGIGRWLPWYSLCSQPFIEYNWSSSPLAAHRR